MRIVVAMVAAGVASALSLVAVTGPAVSAQEEATVVRIVVTVDKLEPGSDGWAEMSDGSKQWVDADCRALLEADGQSVAVLPWPEIAAMPDGPLRPCYELRPYDGTPVGGTPAFGSGVNFASGEYACVGGYGVFEHPLEPLVPQLVALGVGTVRLPMNEHCWLGGPELDYLSPTWSGEPYRAAIVDAVDLLTTNGLTVVLDLHWNAPAGDEARGQEVMADADNGPTFWASVASTFRTNDQVVFDVYNEPYGISWPCWRDGCIGPDGWQIAGMQDLVDAIRGAGAEQPIILNGLDFAGNLLGWLDHVPNDPADNLLAGFHAYNEITIDGTTHQKRCVTEACWAAEFGPIVAAGYEVVIGEAGQDVGSEGCATDFLERLYDWADANGVPYLGWSYNPHGCGSPSLLTSYDGALSPAGEVLAAHLEPPPPTDPVLSVVSQTVTESERNQSITVVFELDKPATKVVTARYATTPGTATRNRDYVHRSGRLRFAAGATRATARVTIKGDGVVESTEAFGIVLAQPSAGLNLGEDGMITIEDDDVEVPAPIVSVESKTVAEMNRSRSLRLRVTLDAPATQRVSVSYATEPGTAVRNADYNHRAGRVVFNRGQSSKWITVIIRGDTNPESTEQFAIVLDRPTGVVIGQNGTITIVDDD